MLSFDDVQVWFTSDNHFFHEGIIAKCLRPYSSTDAMDADMIARWNDCVRPKDVVLHLGDLAMGLPNRWPALLATLHGRKILMRGNHDRVAKWYGEGLELLRTNEIVLVNGMRCWLNHYPKSRGPQDVRHRRPAAPGDFDIALCGHVHHNWLVQDGVINVGVDRWQFAPVQLDRLMPLAVAA